VHGTVCHEPQVDQQPKTVPGEEKLQFYVLGYFFFFHEELVHLGPEVGADYAYVVWHVGRPVDRDADFGQIGEDVVFVILRSRVVELYEKEEDCFQLPPLGVDFDVQARVGVFFEGDQFVVGLIIKRELFAT